MSREAESCYTEYSLMDILGKAGAEADGRMKRGIRHPFSTILLIMLMGYLLGRNTYRGICRLFQEQDMYNSLKALVDLPHGLPSYSTMSRAMKAADPVILACSTAEFFFQILNDDRQQICLDGKAIIAAQSKCLTGANLYIVNVFVAGINIFLNHMRVGPKKQEGKVIEAELANILGGLAEGTVVTADAMSTKKAILEKICRCHYNAILPVKKNNSNLRDRILRFIAEHVQDMPDALEYYEDIGPHSPEEIPGSFVCNPVVKIYEEDNRKDNADAAEVCPESELSFYDNYYHYIPAVSDNDGNPIPPVIDAANRSIIYVLINGRWVPMVKTHGRFERREYELFVDDTVFAMESLSPEFGGWDCIRRVGQVTRYRAEWKRDKDTKERVLHVSVTRTPYILSSLVSVKEFAETIRRHWAIEEFHGVIDELFNEDRSTVRIGHGPENCSLIRKIAYNILSVKQSISSRSDNGKDYYTPSKSEGFRETMQNEFNTIGKIWKFLSHRIRSPFK